MYGSQRWASMIALRLVAPALLWHPLLFPPLSPHTQLGCILGRYSDSAAALRESLAMWREVLGDGSSAEVCQGHGQDGDQDQGQGRDEDRVRRIYLSIRCMG